MTHLPAAFIDEKIPKLDRWWVLAGELTTSEAARAWMQALLSRYLHSGELSTVPLAYIIAMAEKRHVPAQNALREYIAGFIDQDRFNELPLGLREFNKRVLLGPMLPGYGRGNKVIDVWTRDVVIAFLVGEAMRRWQLKKKQAAYLVGVMLKRRGVRPHSTRQILDIYDHRDSLGARVVAFMMASIPDDETPAE
jgi:hypothetical protein